MVLISSKKYACETCIKGHRSTACKHTDRPLFEIKKKGRPVTQCEHCRELRKTKQVHVKCICETKEDSNRVSGAGKQVGNNRGLEDAAFPSGLPEGSDVSISPQTLSEGGSDSDLSGEQCGCQSGGDCHCCTPRTTIRRNSACSHHAATDPAQHVVGNSARKRRPLPQNAFTSSRTTSQVLARLSELRPVLPRPPSDHSAAEPSYQSPSGITSGQVARHHTHENQFFSPYGRAYGYNHAREHVYSGDQCFSQTHPQQSASSTLLATPIDRQPFPGHVQTLDVAPAWVPASNASSTPAFPSMCSCGRNCRCSGCYEHKEPGITSPPSQLQSCTNPQACTTCLNCTVLSLPSPLPSDTSLSPYEPYQGQAIDDWLRQVSPLPSSAPIQSNAPNAPSLAMSENQIYNPHSWETFGISEPTILPEGLLVGADCGMVCACPPGLCQCENQVRLNDRNSGIPTHGGRNSRPGLTFATSGERVSCYAMRPGVFTTNIRSTALGDHVTKSLFDGHFSSA